MIVVVCIAAEARAALVELPGLVARLDVATAGEAELKLVLREVRAAQRCLDGLVIRIGARSDLLAADGRAAPAEEVMRTDGSVSARQARREADRARTSTEVDGLDVAVTSGDISGDHVDSIGRHAAKLNDEQRSEFDFDTLLERAKDLPPETFDRLARRMVEQAIGDHGRADTAAKQAASEFRHWFDGKTGMGRFVGALDPERYEALTNAIDRRTVSLSNESGESMTTNLAAAALLDLATGGRRRAGPPSVLVVVDHETLARGPHEGSLRQTEGGHDIAAVSVQRLCCDAVVRRVVFDERGVPVDVGRQYRTATDGQWAAIKAMYSTCAWNGCGAPIAWCQAHHIKEWDRGGATDLDNLVPLCSQHHHRVHEGQWRIQLEPNRCLTIFKPNGAHHVTVPRPMRC